DRLDGAALAGSVSSLEQDNDPELLGFHKFLEMAKLDLKLAEFVLVVLPLHPCRLCASRHMGHLRVGSALRPADGDADISRDTASKIDDLISDAVTAGLQIVGPKLVDFLRHSRRRSLPTCLPLVDDSPF